MKIAKENIIAITLGVIYIALAITLLKHQI
jgi:hypothetical protein